MASRPAWVPDPVEFASIFPRLTGERQLELLASTLSQYRRAQSHGHCSHCPEFHPESHSNGSSTAIPSPGPAIGSSTAIPSSGPAIAPPAPAVPLESSQRKRKREDSPPPPKPPKRPSREVASLKDTLSKNFGVTSTSRVRPSLAHPEAVSRAASISASSLTRAISRRPSTVASHVADLAPAPAAPHPQPAPVDPTTPADSPTLAPIEDLPIKPLKKHVGRASKKFLAELAVYHARKAALGLPPSPSPPPKTKPLPKQPPKQKPKGKGKPRAAGKSQGRALDDATAVDNLEDPQPSHGIPAASSSLSSAEDPSDTEK